MALETTTNRVSYNGNSVTTAFSFPYYFLADGDLKVILVDSTTGAETVQVLTTNYTVAGEGVEAGGTVTMLVAPITGKKLVIYRDPALTQGLSLNENDPLPANSVEEAFDRAAMIEQRTRELAVRSITLPDGFTGTFSTILPSDIASSDANSVLMTNDTQDGFEMGPSATDIEDAQANAAAAAASASAASASAIAAAASEASAAATLASALWRGIRRKTSADSPYTVVQGDNGYLILCDTTSGAITVNLPQISGLTLPYTVGVQLDSGANTLTIARGGASDTIDGATSLTVDVVGGAFSLIADSSTAPDTWEVLDMGGTRTANAGLATMATNTIKGNNTGSTSTALDLTVSEVQAMLSQPVLLSSQTVSNQASVNFTSVISSTYTRYEIIGMTIVPQTDATSLTCRVSSDNGSTWISSSNYAYNYYILVDANATLNATGNTGTTAWTLQAGLGNSTGENTAFTMELYNPSETSYHKLMRGKGISFTDTPNQFTYDFGGLLSLTPAINAIQFYMSSGNISGTFRVYGYR